MHRHPLPGILEARSMADNMDYERDTITLMDEEGQEHEFEVVDTLEDNDTEYLGLIPIFPQKHEQEFFPAPTGYPAFSVHIGPKQHPKLL